MLGGIKISVKKQAISPPLPWGRILVADNIQLINTYPVDIMLYFCQILFVFLPNMLNEFIALSNTEPWADILIEVYRLFNNKQYTEAKVLWLRQFP